MINSNNFLQTGEYTDLNHKKEITKEIKCTQQTLKTAYYKEQSKQINQAAEMCKVEEFWLMKLFKMSKCLISNKNVITTEMLTEHFKQHLTERDCEKQPEVREPIVSDGVQTPLSDGTPPFWRPQFQNISRNITPQFSEFPPN